jgi:uncharacterized membrane protein
MTRSSGFEELLGARLFVWVGSLALALAGAFLVKVSFDRGWISPSIRVTLGILFGLALLGVGEAFRKNTPGIAHALSAAGIADLFACFYAATQVYQLVSPAIGFGLMALTALVAVVLALRQGAIVAIIGLVGGFLTPALIQTGHPDARALFTYLLILAAGILAVAARRGWWWLGGAAVGASLLWVAVWLAYPNTTVAATAIWLDGFLLALAGVVLLTRRLDPAQRTAPHRPPTTWLAVMSLAAILPALGLTSAVVNFPTEEWGFFLLLSAALLVLAWFDSFYDLLPWLAALLAAALLAGWALFAQNGEAPARYHLTAGAVGLLFTVGALVGALAFLRFPGRLPRPGRWASLASAAAVGFFLLAHLGAPIPGLHWGVIALAIAVFLLLALMLFLPRRDQPGAEAAAAALAVGVTALISLAVPLEFENQWITLAWAFELLAVVVLAGRFWLPALPTLARALGLLVLVRLLLNPALASYPLGTRPVWNGLLLLYGVPLVCFLLAARHLARHGWHGPNETGVLQLEWGGLLLGTALLTLEIRQSFHPGHPFDLAKVGFLEAGALAAGWMLLGWGLLRAHRAWSHPALAHGGHALLLLGVASALVGPGLAANPLWTADPVGDTPVLNLVLLVFGGCTALAGVGAVELRRQEHTLSAVLAGVAAQLLAFTLVTLEVRQAFHGANLASAGLVSSERYAYSAAWIVLGLALLIFGVLRKSGGRALRYGSLAVMLVAVGKVFLSDTAHLSDLYRVFSFLGLGVSLLILGFLYQRFVFRRPPTRPTSAAPLILAFLLFMPRPGHAAMSNVEYRRPIVVSAPGWVRVPLDLAALRHLEGGLRLNGPNGEQVTFRLTSYLGDTERRPVKVSAIEETPDGWTLRLDLGAGSPPHERLFLSFTKLAVVPAVVVEASTDGQNWEPLAAGDLFRLGAQEGLESTSLAYLPTDARYLRLNWPRSAGLPKLDSVEAETVPGRALVIASVSASCRSIDKRRTICRLPLPASGQTVRQLRLDVVGGGDTGYRLMQPRLATWQPLAAGVWRSAAGPARHTLTLPSEPLAADLLRLELDGATEAVPRLAGYGFELVSQTIVFRAEVAGRFTLSYGGIVAPPPPLGGAEPASAAFPETSMSSAAFGQLGPEQATPIAPLPSAAVAPGSSLAGTHFRSSWALAQGTARPGDVVRFDLPDDVYAEARYDLADIRLAVADRQIPYVHWTPEEPTLVLERADLAPMAEKGRHYSRLELSMPESGLPLTDVLLTTPPTPLVRPIGIRFPAPGPAGLSPRDERIVGRETWECVPQPPLPCRVSVPLSGPAYRQIALRFADGDNPPLPHLDVSVWRRGDALFFVWPERGPVHLLAGADTLQPPVYDLAALADAFPGQAVVQVALQSGPEGGNGVESSWSGWVLPVTLVAAAALLLLLLQRILRPSA